MDGSLIPPTDTYPAPEQTFPSVAPAQTSRKNKYYVIGGVVLVVLLALIGGYIALGTGSSPVSSILGGASSTPAGNAGSCQAEYEKLIADHGQSYTDCGVNVTNAQDCSKAGSDTRTKNIVLILDASGSMNEKINGISKIDLAKQAATDFVQKVDPSVHIAIVVYGEKGSNAVRDKAASCQGIETVAPLAAGNQGTATAAITGLVAKGWTPIAGGLERAQQLLTGKDAATNKNLVILVTDGEETCGGNPTHVAQQLLTAPEKIQTNVIAFNLTPQEEASLKDIASAGGGTFATAEDGASLASALEPNVNFMGGFDCAMAQDTVWIQNGLDVTNKHTECTQRLNTDEKLSIDQAVAFDVSEGCKDYVRTTYQARYDQISAHIEQGYQDGLTAASRETAKLHGIQQSTDAGENLYKKQ